MKQGPLKHVPAFVWFAGVALFLFRFSLFRSYRFIGNPDRWNHYLSLAKFHADNLARGHLSAWSEHLFSGFDTLTLPFSFMSPLFALPVLLGTNDVVKVLGYVSPIIFATTLSVTYLVLHTVCGDRLAAGAGASIYALSTWSLLKLSQNDNSYLAVFVAPILFWLVETANPDNPGRRIIATTAVIWVCIYWSFLQYFSYLAIFLVAYAAYRAIKGTRTPLVVVATSFALATVLGAPRLFGLFETTFASSRTAGGAVEFVSPELFLRYLDGNIFARSFREALEARGMNLSEGNLLFSSIFASLMLIGTVLRGRYTAVVSANGETREVRYGFLVAFIVIVFLVIHFPTLYHVFGILYGRLSFLHTRFAFGALLPIAIVSTLVLVRPPNWHVSSRSALLIILLASAILALDWLNFETLKNSMLEWFGRPRGTFYRTHRLENPLVAAEMLRFGVLGMAFAVLFLVHRSLRWLEVGALKTILAIVIIGQASFYANHFLTGRHTRTYGMPFERFDLLLAPPQEFRPATPDQIESLHRLLDNESFRSVLICPRQTIPIDCSSSIGLMWRLRLADGYLAGVPNRYMALPWPTDVYEIRAIRFSTIATDTQRFRQAGESPWRLLSLLNVRNAIVINREFYVNSGFRPENLTIVRNPSPYIYPRVYFAAAATAATRAEAEAAIRRHFSPCPPTARCQRLLQQKHPVDYVEGPIGHDSWDDSGSISASFAGDSVIVDFPRSSSRRFLVINEAYDPRWGASANGLSLAIYPTNLVMRGIVVPPSTGRVILTYRSLISDTWKYLAVALPIPAAAGWLIMRRRRG